MKPRNNAQLKTASVTGQTPDTSRDKDQSHPEPQASVELGFDQIDIEAGTHSRPLHGEVAEEYAVLMKAGIVFPAVDVYQEDGKYYLADGFHRLVAAQQAGRQTIPAHVHRGGRLDALKAALGANETHGLRRTIEDKRFGVDRALGEFSDLSDRAIAEMCCVSPTFVGERRKLQVPTVHVDSSTTEPAKRRGRDGKTRHLPKSSAMDRGDGKSAETGSVDVSGFVAAPATESKTRAGERAQSESTGTQSESSKPSRVSTDISRALCAPSVKDRTKRLERLNMIIQKEYTMWPTASRSDFFSNLRTWNPADSSS